MKIITRQQIDAVLPTLDPLPLIEAGFDAYSAGRAVIPPVGELLLDKGEVHIKYGCLRDDAHYVIKVASGFHDNPRLGLPSGNGLMLLFDQQTGGPVAALLDEGCLTDLRTAVAGAIAAKHLAPRRVERIGILGTGTQARLQLIQLEPITECREVLVWGRGDDQLERYRTEMEQRGFRVETTRRSQDLLRRCNLVVSTTPSTEPLLYAADLAAGTHITAVGSDTPHKQELEAEIVGRADLIVADSIEQCLLRGEIHKAIEAGQTTADEPVELGNVVAGRSPGRTSEDQISIADLTGIAVQDLKIAEAVLSALG